MRALRISLAVLLALTLAPNPAIGADGQPWDVPAPSWADRTGAPAGFHWGNWVPCLPEYRQDDCIISTAWIKADGTSVPGVWTPSPGFNYSTWSQRWVAGLDGTDLQYFDKSFWDMGGYRFSGLVTPCGDDVLYADVRSAMGGLQANWNFSCGPRGKFTERMSVSIRSTHLPGHVGALTSSGRDPVIEYDLKESTFTITASFAYLPSNRSARDREWLQVCEQNEERAVVGEWTLFTAMTWLKQWNDPYLAENPGDMIAGTNGWNCGGFLLWDPKESALVMKVGAPHYDVDGSVVEGWFEGQVRGRYVRSRYGIAPQLAAGKARLEITYGNGEVKVATLTAKYDADSDWIIFRGYGFTYSTPTLVLRFEKPVEQIAAPVGEAIPVAKVKKTTITCIKGKTIKKISAINPLCSKGYKKK